MEKALTDLLETVKNVSLQDLDKVSDDNKESFIDALESLEAILKEEKGHKQA
jgi:hypothetical protein